MKQAVSVSIKEKQEVKWYSVKWRNGRGGDELQLKSAEFPRPELEWTLESFAEFIPLITCIPKEKIRWCLIAGATYHYNETTGAVGLSLGVALENTAGYQIEFKTPVKRLDYENPDLEKSTLWEDRYTLLAKKLEEEILLYSEGKRAQTELDFDGEEKALPPGNPIESVSL